MDQEVVDAVASYAFNLVSGEKKQLMQLSSPVLPFLSPLDTFEEALERGANCDDLLLCLLVLQAHPAVGLSEEQDESVKSLCGEYLPLLYNHFASAKRLWRLTLATLDEDDPKLLSLCIAVLVRASMRLLFPWRQIDGRRQLDRTLLSSFDIRLEQRLPGLILRLLNSDSVDIRRYGLFLLKQILKVNQAGSPAKSATVLTDTHLQESWSQFVLLYSTCQEKQVHLLRPLLGLFGSVLGHLGSCWWQTAIRRGLVNSAVSIRKLCLQRAVFSLSDEHIKLLLHDRPDGPVFLFEHLVELLGASASTAASTSSSAFLFTSSSDAVNLASPFGEAVADFYERVLLISRGEFLQGFVRCIAENVVSAIPLFYLLQPLVSIESPEQVADSADMLRYLTTIAKSRGLHNRKARRLVHWQIAKIARNHLSPQAVKSTPIRDMCEFLGSIAHRDLFRKEIGEWLLGCLGEEHLTNVVYLAFARSIEQQGDSESLLIVEMLCKYSSPFPHFLTKLLKPMREAIGQISASRHLKTSRNVLIALLKSALQVERAIGYACVLVDPVKLLTICSIIEDEIMACFVNLSFDRVFAQNEINVPQAGQSISYADMAILLDAFSVCLERSRSEQVDALAFADMLLNDYLLPAFPPIRQEPPSHCPTSIDHELAKLVRMTLLERICETYEATTPVPTPSIHKLLSSEFLSCLLLSASHENKDRLCPAFLVRPVYLSDAEWYEWPAMEQNFEVERHNLISSIARLAAKFSLVMPSAARTLEYCLDRMAFCKYNSLLANLNCIRTIIGVFSLISDASGFALVEYIERLCETLRDILSVPETSAWTKAYGTGAIDLICSSPIMRLLGEPRLHGPDGCIRYLLNWIIECCESRLGVLVVRISQLFAQLHSEIRHLYSSYSSLVCRLACFGPSRDVPEEKLAECLVGERSGGAEEWFLQDDCMARVYQVLVFNSLTEEETVGVLIDEFLDSRLAIRSASEVERVKRTAFPNTAAHRARLRAWMSLLVLTHSIGDPIKVRTLIEKILDDLFPVEPLSETRIYAEWIVFDGLFRFGSRIPNSDAIILDRISGDALLSLSPASACSYMNILVWLAKARNQAFGDAEFVVKAREAVIPFFLSNAPRVRLAAFWAFDAIDSLIKLSTPFSTPVQDDSVGKARRDMHRTIRETKHGQQFLQKMQSRPVVSMFDPQTAKCLQGIFDYVPRLTQVIAADEYIAVEAFEAVTSLKLAAHIPPRPLNEFPAIPSKPNAIEDEDPEVDARDANMQYQQKKILEDDLPLCRELARQKTRTSSPTGPSLIIVASLLDRIPNMAALCRTAEVLGADELILADVSVCASKDFQSVCMTSDRWIPTSQVSPEDLAGYLEDARSNHAYRVVAVEQSATSVPLHEFTFPHRVILVLGNELEGVRADLLQICDACVEIPQAGVVRSLNVHAAASAVIWEYRKQRLAHGK